MKISRKANQLIRTFEAALAPGGNPHPRTPLYAGVDLGTAYIVTAVVDGHGLPVAGVVTNSRSSIRDGLVLDYVGAVSILRTQVQMLHEAGFPIRTAAAAYPPGTTGRNAQTFGNVLEAVGLKAARPDRRAKRRGPGARYHGRRRSGHRRRHDRHLGPR